MAERKALGRGLDSLIKGTQQLIAPQPNQDKGERVQLIPVGSILVSPYQPRKRFRPHKMAELVDSIREHGIQQPIIVRPQGQQFELIAGERRWRAAKELGLKTMPAIVRNASDELAMIHALMDNLQRDDLDPIEEAQGYQRLIDTYRITQDELAKRVGKNRATVTNSLRLLQLSPLALDAVSQEQLSVGHAKVILGLTDPQSQDVVVREVISRGYTVRQTESLVASMKAKAKPAPSGKSPKGGKSQHADWKDL